MEDIGGHLEFFQKLDHAKRMLNYPGESLIFQADFLDMVNRVTVDICIEFLKSHVRPFVVASKSSVLIIFLATLSRSRSLSPLIPAMHDLRYDTDQDEFVGSLRALSSEILKRLRKRRLADSPISPPLHAFQVGIHESGSISRRARATGAILSRRT